MRVPLSWLRDFNDCELPLEEIAAILTRSGLEVEAIERIGALSREVRVARITSVRDIPGSRDLRAVELDLGGGRSATAVTGAPNVSSEAAGRPAPVALPGAILVDGTSEVFATVRVAPREFRGIASNAVLCSEKELGLSDAHEGVLLLETGAEPGTPIETFLGAKAPRADIVLEIAILPNYGRCLSIVGVARELAALTRTNLRLRLDASYLPLDENAFEVRIEAPDAAPRYSCCVLENARVDRSPEWMERRLALAGLHPINNLVDVTNYVMLELGQPMHAFDLDRLPARNIAVRRARKGERMYTLDQKLDAGGTDRDAPRELDDSVLLITSGDKPVAVAGVIGGLESQIFPDTRNVLLESANFDAVAIRKAMTKLRIATDSSVRFSRHVDPTLTVVAIQRAAYLLEKSAGATPRGGIADCYPRPVSRRDMDLETRDISRVLGLPLSDEQVASSLERLGFSAEIAAPGKVHIDIPGFRPDISQPADVAEEVIRIVGFDRIEERLLDEPLPRQRRNTSWEIRRRIRACLIGCGLSDVLNYSLTAPESEARLRAAEEEAQELPPYVTILNPSSQERRALRRTVLGSLMENVVRNHRHRERIALFELGPVFLPEKGDGRLPLETWRLSIVLSGPVREPSWAEPRPRATGFHDLQGIVSSLLRKLHVEGVSFTPARGSPYHPGIAAALLIAGIPAGTLGQVHPAVIEAYDLDDRTVLAADLDLARLVDATRSQYRFRPFSRFPPVHQDIALVVGDDVPAGRVLEAIRETAGPLLQDVRLFDLYRGPQIVEGKKSLAFQMSFVAPDRSLEESEVNAIREAMLAPLAEKLGAQIRT